MMVGVGLLSFVAQIGLTVSLQLEEAGKVSIMRKAGDILFAFLFQITIFNVSLHCTALLCNFCILHISQDIPGMWSIIGAVIVSLTVLLSSAKKVVDNLPEDHAIKTKYLSWFYKENRSEENNFQLQTLAEKNSWPKYYWMNKF